jgi:hypothetical protein
VGLASEQKPVLALWSAPRCRSTAFERMMTERGDRVVVHEPFSRVVDFGTVEIGDRVAHTEQDVIAALRRISAHRPVFFKDTTDFHYPAVLDDEAFLLTMTHTFIIRDPVEAIASHHALNQSLGCDEIGFARLHEIFTVVQDATGTTPVVIDSDDLLDRPTETVRAYCAAVGIPFIPEALSWEPGMQPEWQTTSRWHQSTSETTSFARGTNRDIETPFADPVLRAHSDYHQPYYDELRAVAIRP